MKKHRLLKLKQALHKLRKFNGVPIAVLIFLTVATIVTIAVIQSQRTTTISRAATTCPSGVGTYMAKAGCEQVCGVDNCKSCILSTTTKYYCDASLRGAEGSTGGGTGGYNLPKCSGYNTAIKSTCEKEFGAGTCTQCSNDGSSVRWHKGSGGGVPEGGGAPGGTQECDAGKTCQQRNSSKYTSNTTTFLGKTNNLYYGTSIDCINMQGIGKSLGAICGSTVSTTQNCTQNSKTCSQHDPEGYVNNNAMIFIGDDDGKVYSNEATCENKGVSSSILAICGNPQTFLQNCSSSERNCPDCDKRYFTGTYRSSTRYFPSSEAKQCSTFLKSGGTLGKSSISEACNCTPDPPPLNDPEVIPPGTLIPYDLSGPCWYTGNINSCYYLPKDTATHGNTPLGPNKCIEDYKTKCELSGIQK